MRLFDLLDWLLIDLFNFLTLAWQYNFVIIDPNAAVRLLLDLFLGGVVHHSLAIVRQNRDGRWIDLERVFDVDRLVRYQLTVITAVIEALVCI